MSLMKVKRSQGISVGVGLGAGVLVAWGGASVVEGWVSVGAAGGSVVAAPPGVGEATVVTCPPEAAWVISASTVWAAKV